MLRRIFIGGSIAINLALVVIAFTPLANRLAEGLYVKPRLIESDLIVVLGGGAYENGILSYHSMERLLRGVVLYREGYAPRIAFVGGTIRNRAEKVMHTLSGSISTDPIDVVEADLMAALAHKLGVPAEAVFVDKKSTNTYWNLKAVKLYMEKEGLASCLVVTSATHIRRAMAVARRLGLRCYPAPVESTIAYRNSPEERIALMSNLLWEFVALKVYRLYGYI